MPQITLTFLENKQLTNPTYNLDISQIKNIHAFNHNIKIFHIVFMDSADFGNTWSAIYGEYNLSLSNFDGLKIQISGIPSSQNVVSFSATSFNNMELICKEKNRDIKAFISYIENSSKNLTFTQGFSCNTGFIYNLDISSVSFKNLFDHKVKMFKIIFFDSADFNDNGNIFGEYSIRMSNFDTGKSQITASSNKNVETIRITSFDNLEITYKNGCRTIYAFITSLL